VRRYASKLKEGDVFLGYFIAYPLGRFWVEMFRPDAWRMGNLATAQWISLIFIVAATALLIYRHRPGATPAMASVTEPQLTEPAPEIAAEKPEQPSSDSQPTGAQ
jgi:prolipoprotein diacylglyceryltransferase